MPQEKNLSESIADKIKGKIITGEYPIGSRLPNEQELSVSLNVSRTTIREAVKLLISRHVLEIERGRGTFVATVPGISDDPFGLEFVPAEKLYEDIYIFRKTIEPEVCTLAAEKASPRQIKEMHDLVLRMNQLSQKVSEPPYDSVLIDALTNCEMEFHTLVYKMTHNIMFERLSNIISQSIVASYTSIAYREGFNFSKSTKIHEDLYEAIVAHDVEAARALGDVHMIYFKTPV